MPEHASLPQMVEQLSLWVATSPDPRQSALLLCGAAAAIALRYYSAAELRQHRTLAELLPDDAT